MRVRADIKNPLYFSEKEKDEVLKRFMKEFFHFPSLCKAGFFTKEMKGDYKAQAERVCKRFGFKTVYEYGLTAKHTSSDNGFTYKMDSIYT
jgi:hypothetical protein